MKKLQIKISPEGEVSVEVQGVAGASCVTNTEFLEAALGGPVVSREMTADYYQTESETVEVKS